MIETCFRTGTRHEFTRGVSEIFSSDFKSQGTSFDDGQILSCTSESAGIQEKEKLS